jgi:hypothetical protein
LVDVLPIVCPHDDEIVPFLVHRMDYLDEGRSPQHPDTDVDALAKMVGHGLTKLPLGPRSQPFF